MRLGAFQLAVFLAGAGACASGCGLLADFRAVEDTPRDPDGTGGVTSSSGTGGGSGSVSGSGGSGGGVAPAPSYACVWSEEFGTAAGQTSGGFALDVDGNVWLTGGYKGQIQFGETPALAEAGTAKDNVFVAKLDAATGRPLFSVAFGDALTGQTGDAIAADARGIYFSGRFGGELDLGPGCGTISSSTSNNDVFIAALSTAGDCLHRVGFQSDPTSQTAGIALDNGNAIVALSVDDSRGIFIRAHTPELNNLSEANFARAPTKSLQIHPHALFSQGGQLFVAGDFNGSEDPVGAGVADDYLTSDGAPDAFMVGYRYPILGKREEVANVLLWGKGYGGAPSGSQSVLAMSSVSSSAAASVFVTGWFDTSMNLDDPGQPAFTAQGGKDTFLAAVNVLDGTTRWSKSIGGSGDQLGTAVAFDQASKAVLVGGSFQGEVDLGGEHLQNADGFDHIFLARFDEEGKHPWIQSFGADGAQAIKALALFGNNVFVIGSYKGTLDLGCEKLVNNDAAAKIFVAKLKPIGF